VKDYATIANTLGAFPDVTGKDASGGGATDGTPYIRQVIDDLWGFSQAIMDAASLTPDGVTEVHDASQRLEGIRRISGYPGEVVPWMGEAADPGAGGIRLLPLNGQGVLRASYTELDTVVYVGDGDNPTAPAFYHADDAGGTIRNTTGIYLILPDLRGYFLRGLDPSATIDPDGASREIGDSQDDDVLEHGHDTCDLSTGTVAPTFPQAAFFQLEDIALTGAFDIDVFVGQDTPFEITFDINGVTVADGNESRPYNSACRWCIRY
jgi:hypothetical protein